jgi:hypothetical protein
MRRVATFGSGASVFTCGPSPFLPAGDSWRVASARTTLRSLSERSSSCEKLAICQTAASEPVHPPRPAPTCVHRVTVRQVGHD